MTRQVTTNDFLLALLSLDTYSRVGVDGGPVAIGFGETGNERYNTTAVELP